MMITVIIGKYSMINCFVQGALIHHKSAQQFRAPTAPLAPRQTLQNLAVQGVTVLVAQIPEQTAQQQVVTIVQLAGAILLACHALWTQR